MRSTALCTNTLLEYRLDAGKTRTERILWIDPSGDLFVTIDIDRKNKHALPIWKTREEIESALETGNAGIVTTDPWAVLPCLYDALPEESKKIRQAYRERAWEAIKSLIQDNSSSL